MTHPFHPLHGREWDLLTYRHNWGEDRVYFHDSGRVRSLPATWTSLSAVDPLVALGAGRSPFRVSDLLELAKLIEGMERAATDCGLRGRGSGDV